MMNIFKRLLLAVTLFTISTLSYAQIVPPPTVPPAGGTGSGGTGTQASPIDGDLWILAAVCIIFIAVFAVRYRRMSATN